MKSFIIVLTFALSLNEYFCSNTSGTTIPHCPQYENATIPDGTDAQIIQYAIDGHNCIIQTGEYINLRINFDGTLAEINRVYDESELICSGRGVTDQIHKIVNNGMTKIYNVATDTFARQTRLYNAAWLKIAERKTADSSEIDIVNAMQRVRRVTRIRYNIATLAVARILPEITEVNEEAACKIVSILRHCVPERKSEEIAEIRRATVDKSVEIITSAQTQVLAQQGKILAALNHALQYIRENSENSIIIE